MEMAKSGVDQLNKLNLDKLYVFSPFLSSAASAGSLNLQMRFSKIIITVGE